MAGFVGEYLRRDGSTTLTGDWNAGDNEISIITSSGNSLQLTPSGDAGASQSVGGVLNIFNTNNPGSAIVVYTNEDGAATGSLMQIGADNPAFDQTVFRAWNDGIGKTALFTCNNATSSNDTVTVTNVSTNATSLGISGNPTAKGVAKIVHNGTAGDGSSSGVSVDLAGSGTAAKGLFVDATGGGTTGDLLDLRNDGDIKINGNSDGQLGILTNNQVADLDLNGSQAQGVTVVDAATDTIQATDNVIAIDYTDTGAVTLTLPAASDSWNTDGSGIVFTIKDSGANAATNNITINRAGSDTIIDDSTAQTSTIIAANGGAIKIQAISSSKWIDY